MDSPKEGGHAFGGALCGPVFHEVAERCASYLNIPPDENLQPQIAPRQIVATAQNNLADSMNNSRPQLFGMLAGLFLAAGLVLSSMLATTRG